jgi:hypothetical protein
VFYGDDGMTVTLIAMHTDTQYVRIIKNGVVVEDTHFTHGMPMTIGRDAEIGYEYTIYIAGYQDGAQVELSLNFTKTETPEPAQIRVEYVRDQNPWDRAGIWAWGGQGDVFSGGWPGPEMEWVPRLDGEGYAWVFYLPEDTPVPVTLIFNNFGEGEQTTPYLTIMESTRVFQIGDGQEIGDVEPIR